MHSGEQTQIRDFYNGKTILVTGGVGSIGSEVVRSVLRYGPRAVRALDNNETGLFDLERELQSGKFRPLVGDIRDKERLRRAIEDVDVVFHAAALKHVPLCEYNPFEAVKTNVLGTQNLVEVAMEEEVEKLITISTDKAVNPVGVMGATKLLAERLTISANYYEGLRKTAFSCVRFGNVLESRGSVVPSFGDQIRNGGPVTLTDPNMTRFVMTIPKAVDLVLKAAEIARGGEIFIFKMPALRIGDLAEAMIEEAAPRYAYDPKSIELKVNGKRAGEKVYEQLLTEDEAVNAWETEDMVIITRAGEKRESKKISVREYRSDRDALLLTKEQIKEMMREILP